MITILGGLLGLLGSFLPEIFKYLNNGQDNKHEQTMYKLQKEVILAERQYKLEEVGVYAQMEETKAVHAYNPVIGIAWVDALAATVRPLLTYFFFFAYITVKVAQYHIIVDSPSLPWLSGGVAAQQWWQTVALLWTEEDQGIFSAIIGFWFGSRIAGKVRQ